MSQIVPPAASQILELERIYASPALDGGQPRELKAAPDGSRMTFLRGKTDDQYRLDIWEYRVSDGQTRLLVDSSSVLPDEGQLSDEEKARRERQRIAQYSGIVAYSWTADASALLFPLGGDIYLHQVESGETRQLTASETYETDARLSPGSGFVSFVRDQDLFVIDLETGEERALTRGGSGDVTNGMAEFVAQEEMDRDTGYWWAPDDRQIAYLKVDNSPVRMEKRYEVYGDQVRVLEQRYPAAGTPNALVSLAVVSVDGGEARWLDLGPETDVYVPRVNWLPDGRRLAVQRQSRDQQQLDLLLFDLDSGQSRVLLSERSRTWINLHKDLKFLKQQPQFIWSSERSGFRHLYLYDLEGQVVRQLTRGHWTMKQVEGVDEAGGWVYFSATGASPRELHLFRVAISGGEPEQLTRRPGTHQIEMPASADVYIDSYSSRSQPVQISAHRANGKRIAWLHENALEAGHPYWPYVGQHGPVRWGTVPAEDGMALHWMATLPANFDPQRRYPVIVYVYGGPTGPLVVDAWSRRILNVQYWTQRGYVVFTLDNRGVEGYGKAFQDLAYRKLGVVEVRDQLAGVQWLRQQAWVDSERIGVFGWSYGGYMTLMMLMQAPGTFAAGVAAAPVTDWALYDTHYTERYMGLPQQQPEAYRAADVLSYSQDLIDPLLVMHGMADDNVLFTHSTRLMEALQQKAIGFELMTYPGGKHSLVGESVQVHVYRTITDFFDRHLMRQ